MLGDFDHILMSARCSNCGRMVSAPFRELKITGVFACICGTLTRSRSSNPVEVTPFSGASWKTAEELDGD